MPTKSLRHVTLNTGHVRISPRADVPGWVIDQLAPTIRAGGGNIGVPGWRFAFNHRTDGAAVWQIGPDDHASDAWVVCAMCWSLSLSGWAWRNLMDLVRALGLPGDASPITDVPWLAVVMLPGCDNLSADDLAALGDAERCIAWAILDSEAGR